MSNFEKNKSLQTEIGKMESLLERYPAYRETKYKPMAHRLWESLPGQLRTREVRDVLQMITEPKKLPAMETLSRAWRKAIENNPAWLTELHAMERRAQEQKVKNTVN